MAIKISGSTIIADSRDIVAGLAATFTGNVTIGGKLNSLTYPSSNGTDGQVLTSDGAGVVQWEDASGGGGFSPDSQENLIAGTNAGASLTSDSDSNVLIGKDAGDSLTSGKYNVAIGLDALQSASSDQDNVAIGRLAGTNNASDYNVFLGYRAGYGAGSNANIAIGKFAGSALAGSDIAIGNNAMAGNSGGRNIVIGMSALSASNSDASYNTIIGDVASNGMALSGKYNVLLGTRAAPDAVGISSVFVVGHQVGNAGVVTSFSIPGIGLTITSVNDANTSARVLAGLTIGGTLSAGGLTYPTSDGSDGQVLTSDGAGVVQWEDAGGSGTTINNNANNRVITGSGTANTLEAETTLEWDGTNKLTSVNQGGSYPDFIFSIKTVAGGGESERFRVGNGPFRIVNTDYSANSVGDELVVGDDYNDRGITIASGSSNTGNIFFGDSDDNDVGKIQYDHSANAMIFTTNTNETVRITSAGLVGIATASPATPLHVYHATTNEVARFSSGDATCYIGFRDSASHATGTSRPLLGAKGDDMFFQTGGSERVRILSTGLVGIGIDAPTEKLHVIGQVGGTNPTAGSKWDIARFVAHDYSPTNSGGLTIGAYWNNSDGTGRTSYIQSSQSTDSGGTARTLSLNPDGGRVGIGTDDPNQELVIHGSSFTGLVLKSDRTTSTDQIGGFQFMNQAVGVATATMNALVNGTMVFNTAGSEALRIDAAGNIGVNNSNPSAYGKFVVNGTGNIVNINSTSGSASLGFYEGGTGRFFLETIDGADGLSFIDGDGSTTRMRIQANGEIAMRSSGTPSDALANLHVQNETLRVSNDTEGADTTFIHLNARPSSDDGDLNIMKYVSNGVINYQTTRQGQIFTKASMFIGRTRTDQATSTTTYFNANNGIFAYSGTTTDSTAYRTVMEVRAWDAGDVADRNCIYFVDSQADDTAADYDQDQRFGVKANGMTHCREDFWSGRIESNEGTPNSVYTTANTNLIRTYADNSNAQTYIQAVATPATNIYSMYIETGTSNADDDIQLRIRSSDGRISSDNGTITTPADYAEMFEWEDGNPSNEDRVGTSVVLVGEKIRASTSSDDASQIIGIVSATPAIVGDAAPLKHHARYLKDEWGRDILEDVEMLVWNIGQNNPQPNESETFSLTKADECCFVANIATELSNGNVPQWAVDQNIRRTDKVRKVNPDYDVNKKDNYEPRLDRKEWEPIGLVGKLYMKKGQKTGTNWIKLSDKTASIERWLVR